MSRQSSISSSSRPLAHSFFCTVLLALSPLQAGQPASPAPHADSALPLPEELPLLAAAPVAALPEGQVMPAPAERASPATSPGGTLATSPSQSVTINLIRKMVQKGLLTPEEADEMIQQAEEEANTARAQASAMQSAIAQVQNTAVEQAGPDPALLAEADDAVRVTYIPENVKAEMREQIKHEVMTTARTERWASPKLVSDWVMRTRLFGDIRVRGEGIFFGEGNDNTGAFPNFNAINTGQPFDVSGTQFSPQLNVDQDRYRLRLRVRFGLETDLGSGFTAGLRIATGENNNPVATNQSLGLANQAQGGNFSKYAIWLDRGLLKYTLGSDLNKQISLNIGRFENPFVSTEIIYDEDLGFDGLSLQGRYQVAKSVTPFFTAGAFPVFNTDFNFSTNRPAKFESKDKWLYGGQLGADWQISKDFNFKGAVAYYHFDGVRGELSDPFIPLNAQDQGNTDDTRPSFAQKGNTYRPIRNIIASPLNNFGTTNQFQYFGLATGFRDLVLTGRLDYNRFEPFQISLLGEYVKNLAFDGSAIDRIAVNNRGPNDALGNTGSFEGGDTAWIVNLRAGQATLQKRGDWQVGVNYRYIESDAVIDGLNDSEFGLGGTNLKGYTLYGSLAISPRIALGLRWMSANEIAGAPFKVDIIQLDIGGRF